jgi:hypothetical protein
MGGAVRPLLQLVTRVMRPPQPIIYAGTDEEALAFLARLREVRSHVKVKAA